MRPRRSSLPQVINVNPAAPEIKVAAGVPGLTLRHYIATEIAKGILQFGETNGRDPKYIAEKSYAIADAMVAKGGAA